MSNYVNLLDIIYPIGSIYITMSSASPAGIIGGSWNRIQDKFLYATDNINTGGENTHTLISAEIPNIYGELVLRGYSDSFIHAGSTANGCFGFHNRNNSCYTISTNSVLTSGYSSIYFDYGGGQPHNNMPAYQGCFIYQRVS